MLPEKNNSLTTTYLGLFCTKCDYYWIHGICKCEPILKVFCNCDSCKQINKPGITKGYAEDGTYIETIQIPDGKLVVTITDKQKRKGFLMRKVPQRVMTFVGKGFNWKHLKSMKPAHKDLEFVLYHIHDNIDKYGRVER